MTDEERDRIYKAACAEHWPNGHARGLLAVAEAAAREAHRQHCELALHAAAELVRLVAPDDVDECYVPRAAVVDIAMDLKRKSDALRAAPEGGEKGER